MSSRSWSVQPASLSAWSMRVRAMASGAFELPDGDMSVLSVLLPAVPWWTRAASSRMPLRIACRVDDLLGRGRIQFVVAAEDEHLRLSEYARHKVMLRA